MTVLRAIWTGLSSTWLTIVLVLALLVVSLAGTLLPQESVTGAASLSQWQQEHAAAAAVARPLGLFDAFSSPLFVATVVLLALNLVVCTLDRTLLRVRRGSAVGVAFAGSLVLHAGLLVVLAGGAVTAAWRFDGTIVATEGQELDLETPAGYVQLSHGPLAGGAQLPNVQLSLDRFKPVYQEGIPTRFDSRLTARVGEGSPRRLDVGVNRPAGVAGSDITHSDFGYSPNLVVRDSRGASVVDGYVALASRRAAGETVYEDFVMAPGLPGRLMLRVYPNLVARGRRRMSASSELKNPALSVRLLRSDGTTRAQALLRPGDEAVLSGTHVEFRDLRYWTAFRITKDPGRPVVYVGFLICVVGLTMRYLRLGPETGPGRMWRGSEDSVLNETEVDAQA